MSMSASEALDYAMNTAPDATNMGPLPRLVLIYVADTGSLDSDYLARRTGASPEDVQKAVAVLAAAGHLDAIRGRWAA